MSGVTPTGHDPHDAEVIHRCCVIGQPVAHSLSPVLHRAAYQSLGLTGWTYDYRELAPSELPGMLETVAAPVATGQEIWHGLSVTMPHKQAIASLVDVIDPLAQAVGSINTVVATRSGRGRALLTGCNTDVEGIVRALDADRRSFRDGPAVILGAGATAASALAALHHSGEAPTEVIVAARQHTGPHRVQAAAHRMGVPMTPLTWLSDDARSTDQLTRVLAEASVVISTLPAGVTDGLAAALSAGAPLRPGTPLLDVIYSPWPTALASAWRDGGGEIIPGWLMLLYQAVPQVHLMTGQRPEVAVMDAALRAALTARGLPDS